MSYRDELTPVKKTGMKFHARIKKEKKTCKHFLPGWSFQMSMFFFLNFWHMYSNMLSKVNMFEHNESMNLMKLKISLLKMKSEKKKDEDNK